MDEKNYYVVLGVPRTEPLSGIRAAYRDLAKRFHPDLAGDAGTKAFQDIAEAYACLSDPKQRLAHDRELDQGASRFASAPPPGPPWRAPVEPLIPDPFAAPNANVEPLETLNRPVSNRLRPPYVTLFVYRFR